MPLQSISAAMITVQPNNVTDVQAIRSEIYRVLGRKYQFDSTDENAISMWDFVSNVKETSKVFVGIEIFLGIIGGLTLLVAGVGVANIMYVSIKERTREIGIMKAVGGSEGQIRMIFFDPRFCLHHRTLMIKRHRIDRAGFAEYAPSGRLDLIHRRESTKPASLCY